MNRVADLERRVYGLVYFATWGSEDAYNEAVAQLKSPSAERIALERELGIKALARERYGIED